MSQIKEVEEEKEKSSEHLISYVKEEKESPLKQAEHKEES